MKTIVYIDGYNLYYGCLKNTAYKWLDIYTLFSEHVVKIQSPQAHIEKIKFFTADVKAKVASRNQEAQQSQNNYHRALSALYPEKIEIIKGYYSLERARLLRYKQPPDKSDRVDVWRLEEKQTDVNIALQLYRDMIQQHCDQVVIVSNDTDLVPALQIIRQDLGQAVNIGVVIPILKPESGKSHRPANASLSQYADWTRRFLLEKELAASQLPEKIATRKKPIIKPDYW